MAKENLKQKIERVCPSKDCNGLIREYELMGVDGVVWQEKLIYECMTCGYPYIINREPEFEGDNYPTDVVGR